MCSILRALGLVLAIGLTVATLFALPVGTHHGITPIHCTTIDTTVMGIGLFLLYATVIGVAVEAWIVALRRPTLERADQRIPRARVVSR